LLLICGRKQLRLWQPDLPACEFRSLDYEQSLFLLRDRRAKRTRERTRKSLVAWKRDTRVIGCQRSEPALQGWKGEGLRGEIIHERGGSIRIL